MALVAVSINMLLPAFQAITFDLKLKSGLEIQLSIALLYLGLGVSQLIYGMLSDKVGRKPAVYLGLTFFIIGCAVSYFSSALPSMLIGQLLQGIGLGAPRVLSVAIVRDQFEGSQMAKAMSYIMSVYIFLPTISPIVGKAITTHYGWRSLFLVFIVFGIIILILIKSRIKETLPETSRSSHSIKQLRALLFTILRKKSSLIYTTILGLYSGVFIAYLNLSQSIFEIQYELGSTYPLYFGALALSIGAALFINGKVVTHFGMKPMVKSALWVSFSVSVIALPFAMSSQIQLWFFALFMFFQLFNYGILVGNLNALAMLPFGHIAGFGSAITGAVSTVISVPLAILIGSLYNNNPKPIFLGFLVVGVTSLFLITNLKKTALCKIK